MDPIDHFVADVEASGEDKKHEALGYMSKPAKRLIEAGHSISTLISANRCDPDDSPICTQAQRDAYAAEAVKQERKRIHAAVFLLFWAAQDCESTDITKGRLEALDDALEAIVNPPKDQP